MAFAAVLFFDATTEATVRRVGSSLVPNAVAADPFAGELRPHVSLGVCDALDAERLRPEFLAFAATTSASEFTLASVGVFLNHAEGVIFLAPVVTFELLRMHAEFYALFVKYAVAPQQYYQPGTWVPHCTLALNLPREQVAAVVHASSRAAGLPIRGRFESIGLIEFLPVSVVYSASLGQ